MTLVEAGTIPILIDLMNVVDEVEEQRDNVDEALANYVDPLYHDSV